MFPSSDPHWARWNLISCMLCTGVNILCKHVQVYVCVCVLRHINGYGNGNRQHKIWSRHQSSGNLRCDWSLMSTGFIILIKICMKTGS
jgi:hypothetical protein